MQEGRIHNAGRRGTPAVLKQQKSSACKQSVINLSVATLMVAPLLGPRRGMLSAILPGQLMRIPVLVTCALLVLALNASSTIAAATNSTQCPQKCGNTTVQYPFGISPRCGLPEFQLNCSSHGTLYLPTPSGNYDVLTFNTTFLIVNTTSVKAMSCDGSLLADGTAKFTLPPLGPYALSPNNLFFVNGCNSSGNFTTDLANELGQCQTSCSNDKPIYDFCNIYSCCAVSIPSGARDVNLFGGGISYQGQSDCGFSSMVYPESYNTSNNSVLGDGEYGVQLLWSLAGSCEAAPRGVCSTNGTCLDVQGIHNYSGYNCECRAGFTGDGFNNGTGCSVATQCPESAWRKCDQDANCVSEGGSYICRCIDNYRGDGLIKGTGCRPMKGKSKTGLGAGLCAAMICLAVAALICCWSWKNGHAKPERVTNIAMTNLRSLKNIRRIFSATARGTEPMATLFTFKELERATEGFADDLKLGGGEFGTVYKGTLDNGTVVAIKRTNHVNGSGTQQFLKDVTVLSQINHQNLVRLLGYCSEMDVTILVYEYIPNGSLFEHLQREQPGEQLDWNRRLQVAMETAEALEYLHCVASPPIHHRHVKSTNILLDESSTAKVTNFGLSQLVPMDATHILTAEKGMPGYLDPEYYQSCQLTEKSDVYSFGVILLELITSQKPVDFNRSSKEVNLVSLALPLIKDGRLEDIVDPQLEASSKPEMMKAIEAMAQLAMICLAFQREDRPTMKELVEHLHQIKGMYPVHQFSQKADEPKEETPKVKSFHSSYVGNSLSASCSLHRPTSFPDSLLQATSTATPLQR